METINKVSKMVGLTRRMIQEYEKAGLAIKPEKRNKYGHLLYDEKEIERLWQLHFYKELGYDKKQIKDIVENPDYDRREALEHVIQALLEKREHLDQLIAIAKWMQETGISFSSLKFGSFVFDDMNFDDLFHLFGTMFSLVKWDTDEKVLSEEPRTEKEFEELIPLFEAFELLMHYCEVGKPCFSDEVQCQIDLIHDMVSKELSDSIYFFSFAALCFAPGGEIAAEIDMDFGKGKADYFYKALQYYCREHMDNPVDREYNTVTEKIMQLHIEGYRADSEEVQLEVGKMYCFFQNWDNAPEKICIERFRDTGKIYGSKACIDILDEGRERGVFWFLSGAIQIYCDRLEAQGVKEEKREEECI